MTAFSTSRKAGFSGVSLDSTIVGNKSEQFFRRSQQVSKGTGIITTKAEIDERIPVYLFPKKAKIETKNLPAYGNVESYKCKDYPSERASFRPLYSHFDNGIVSSGVCKSTPDKVGVISVAWHEG